MVDEPPKRNHDLRPNRRENSPDTEVARLGSCGEAVGVFREPITAFASAISSQDEGSWRHYAPILLPDTSAAEWLGISRATFWRRVGDGTLPRPVKIGALTRWRRDELLAAVERASAARSTKTAK